MKKKMKKLLLVVMLALLFDLSVCQSVYASEVPAEEVAILGASREKQISIDSKIDLLLDGVVEGLTASGWTISMSTPKAMGTIIRKPGYYAGLAIQNYKQIMLSINRDDAEWCILHELGHAVDFEMLAKTGVQPGASKLFYDIWKAESGKARFSESQAYNTSNPLDYFAESFKACYENPAALANCPQTVGFVKATVAKFVTMAGTT